MAYVRTLICRTFVSTFRPLTYLVTAWRTCIVVNFFNVWVGEHRIVRLEGVVFVYILFVYFLQFDFQLGVISNSCRILNCFRGHPLRWSFGDDFSLVLILLVCTIFSAAVHLTVRDDWSLLFLDLDLSICICILPSPSCQIGIPLLLGLFFCQGSLPLFSLFLLHHSLGLVLFQFILIGLFLLWIHILSFRFDCSYVKSKGTSSISIDWAVSVVSRGWFTDSFEQLFWHYHLGDSLLHRLL